MRTPFVTLTGVLLIALLGPAASARAGDGTILGTGIGAAMGGLLGSQIGHGTGQLVSTGIGVAAGGLVGNSIGHDIDATNSTPRYAVPGGSYSDSAPITYNSYAPTYVAPPAPPPTYVDQQAGTYCREFSQEIRVDGHLAESYGTACLQPDGSWRIVQ